MRLELLQHIVDVIRNKFIYFHFYNVQNETYKNLVLGSSHLAGVDFGQEFFNCAFSSCDLYYTNELYKLFNKPDVKNVIISFSVFSPGYSLIRTFDAHLCTILKIMFQIPYQNEEAAKKKHLNFLEFLYGLRIKKFYENYEPKKIIPIEKNIDFEIEKIKQRSLKHFKNNQRDTKQYYILEELLEHTKQNSQNMFIIIPPATHYYKDVLPSSDIIFKGLYRVTSKYSHCKVINLYDLEDFQLSDFSDGDHLNTEGKKKLVAKVYDNIKGFVKKDEDICNV